MISLPRRYAAVTLAFIVVAACSTAFAQQIAWTDSLAMPAGHRFESVQLIATTDGGVLAIGDEDTAVGGGSFQANIMLSKFAPDGSPVWSRHIRGTYAMRFARAYEIRGGNILVAGNEQMDTTAAGQRWSPMVMAFRANGDSIWKLNYGPPPPDNSNVAHCFSVYGVSNDQSLLLCAGSNYTFAYRIDGLGNVGSTRISLNGPRAVWEDFRNGADRIDLVSQESDDTLLVVHLSNSGDSVGATILNLSSLGTSQDRSIANVAPSSTGAYVIGGSLAIGQAPKQWKPAVARFDAAGQIGSISIFPGSAPGDLLLRRVAPMEPGAYLALIDANGTLLRLTQDSPVFDMITFNLPWRFTDAVPATNRYYFVIGYTDPNNNSFPHVAKIGIGASAVESMKQQPIEKLDLW
ncbi:MAG TPA: hypothetical protein VHI13_09155 [Candidatus Kapabacteria bacterium]|nr:hypothetical protein [Candidatus Kapabacteria bacterium]